MHGVRVQVVAHPFKDVERAVRLLDVREERDAAQVRKRVPSTFLQAPKLLVQVQPAPAERRLIDAQDEPNLVLNLLVAFGCGKPRRVHGQVQGSSFVLVKGGFQDLRASFLEEKTHGDVDHGHAALLLLARLFPIVPQGGANRHPAPFAGILASVHRIALTIRPAAREKPITNAR